MTRIQMYRDCPRGGGKYRNLETGLMREFSYPPTRGKWLLVKPRREPVPGCYDWLYESDPDLTPSESEEPK